MLTFTYLFNPNTKYQDIYRILQISPKYRDIFAHIAQPYLLLMLRFLSASALLSHKAMGGKCVLCKIRLPNQYVI